MMALDVIALVQHCAPQVAPSTMASIVQVESSFNPFAIGVVGGQLLRQPLSLAEAASTARALEHAGWNYSVGLAQINRDNWQAYALDSVTAFEPCRNVAAGAAILADCFVRAKKSQESEQDALRASLSCYSSGNFITGFQSNYVQRVIDDTPMLVEQNVLAKSADVPPSVGVPPIPVVPRIQRGFSKSTRNVDTSHRLSSSPEDASDHPSPPGSSDVPQSKSVSSSAVVF